eukprot:gene6711-6931_t
MLQDGKQEPHQSTENTATVVLHLGLQTATLVTDGLDGSPGIRTRSRSCQCKRQDRLISKSNAKAQYLLTDSDVRKLGFLERSNPQHKEWSAMKMYLVSQVEELAAAKHGNLAAVAEEKQRRVKDKIERKAKKRQREEMLQAKQQQHQQALQDSIDQYMELNHQTATVSQAGYCNATDDGGVRGPSGPLAPELAAVEVEEF